MYDLKNNKIGFRLIDRYTQIIFKYTIESIKITALCTMLLNDT